LFLGLKKKIASLAKQKDRALIGQWEKSLDNHLYWIASSSSGDSDMMMAKWLSIINHVDNVHQGQ
jgi:hypothetical protein